MVISALAASVTAASAADVLPPAPAAPPVCKPAPSPAFNWSGFYVGAMGGYGWSADIKGGFAGGMVGFNYHAPGSMFVVGAEADAAWVNINHTETIVGLGTAKEQIKAFGSVTGGSASPWIRCCYTARAATPERTTSSARRRLG
jgi:outer membrane immunogenic protein